MSWWLCAVFSGDSGERLQRLAAAAAAKGGQLVAAVGPEAVAGLGSALSGTVVTLDLSSSRATHAVGDYRRLVAALDSAGVAAPIWIRCAAQAEVLGDATFLGHLVEAAMLSGSLLCDGIGDLLSFETVPDTQRAHTVTYNLLQGAGARISKTEFVACPSCGRTLFDLQTTTQRIRGATGHLKGVKIAIMGCIVNGPGEMADADFGYVGGAPGKVNLYVGKTAVKYNVPEEEAVVRLTELIREHGKWFDPEPAVGD